MTKSKLKNLWLRISHNWSWFDSIVSGTLMLAVGYIIGWAAGGPLPILQVTGDTLFGILKLWGTFMFFGRGWQIARYPRAPRVKLSDLKGNWPAVLYLNYVAWFHFAVGIMFAYSLAPEIGQIAKAFE